MAPLVTKEHCATEAGALLAVRMRWRERGPQRMERRVIEKYPFWVVSDEAK